MTGKERVEAAFTHQPSDRVPLYMGNMSSRVASMVLGREAYVGGGIQRWREAKALWEGEAAHEEFLERSRQDALALPEALNLDYVRPSYWRYRVKPTKRIDEHTFLFGDPDGLWRVMRFYPETELFCQVDASFRPERTLADLEKEIERVEASISHYAPTKESFPDIVAALAKHGATRAVHGIGIDLALPWYEDGDQVWLEAVVVRPDLVGRLLDTQLARTAKNIAVQAKLGVKYLHGGGDFAGKHGPVYSPKVFHDLMLPRLQQISQLCHAHGCYHMFASDGNLWPVAEDLFGRSGVDAFYEIDRDAGMDLARLRQRYPHLTLLGGISSRTLHVGEPADVKREVMSALEVAKNAGSIIVGCSNLVVPATPYRNFMTMMETLHAFR